MQIPILPGGKKEKGNKEVRKKRFIFLHLFTRKVNNVE